MYILKKKSKGAMDIFIVFLMIFVILSLVLTTVIRYNLMITLAQGIQDDLILSNSSVYKCIDKKALGEDNPQILINDYTAAFNEMKKHLIKNMKLNNNLDPKENYIITSKIEVTDFIIYNHKGDTIDVVTYNNGSFIVDTKNALNSDVITKNGHKVENTVVTTTISMDIKGMMGISERQSVSVDTNIVIGN